MATKKSQKLCIIGFDNFIIDLEFHDNFFVETLNKSFFNCQKSVSEMKFFSFIRVFAEIGTVVL
jgi:hypothetical protein